MDKNEIENENESNEVRAEKRKHAATEPNKINNSKQQDGPPQNYRDKRDRNYGNDHMRNNFPPHPQHGGRHFRGGRMDDGRRWDWDAGGRRMGNFGRGDGGRWGGQMGRGDGGRWGGRMGDGGRWGRGGRGEGRGRGYFRGRGQFHGRGRR